MVTDLREVMAAGWIRTARVTKHNRLPSGEPEVIYGPWHVILAQDQSQTWCGRKMAGLIERREDNPIGLALKVCDECKHSWERGTPFPRATPAETNRFSSKTRN